MPWMCEHVSSHWTYSPSCACDGADKINNNDVTSASILMLNVFILQSYKKMGVAVSVWFVFYLN